MNTLLRIDYISTCVIHFKCTLLLEDIISWHVGGRFFLAHSVVLCGYYRSVIRVKVFECESVKMLLLCRSLSLSCPFLALSWWLQALLSCLYSVRQTTTDVTLLSRTQLEDVYLFICLQDYYKIVNRLGYNFQCKFICKRWLHFWVLLPWKGVPNGTEFCVSDSTMSDTAAEQPCLAL